MRSSNSAVLICSPGDTTSGVTTSGITAAVFGVTPTFAIAFPIQEQQRLNLQAYLTCQNMKEK